MHIPQTVRIDVLLPFEPKAQILSAENSSIQSIPRPGPGPRPSEKADPRPLKKRTLYQNLLYELKTHFGHI